MSREQAGARRAEFHRGLEAFHGPIKEQRQYNLEYQAEHFFWSASALFMQKYYKRGLRYEVSLLILEMETLPYYRATAAAAIARAFKPLYRSLRNRGYA